MLKKVSLKKSKSVVRKNKAAIFDSIAKYSIYVLVVLLPILFFPTPLIELGQVKLGLFILAITVVSVSLGISAIYTRSFKIPSQKVLIPVVLISVITFLSTLFSTSYKGGFFGLGNEMDSWYTISLFLLSVILVSAIINTKEKIFTTTSLFWAGFGLASLFQILRLIASVFALDGFSNLLSFGGLFDLPALNTVGTWADFGIMAGVVSLSLAITLDMVPLRNSIKKTFWFLFAFSTTMSFLASSLWIGSGIDQLTMGSNFVVPSMTMVGIIALIFGGIQIYRRRQDQKNKSHTTSFVDKVEEFVEAIEGPKEISSIKFPLASFILICLGAIIMISPLALNQKINHALKVPSESVLNVRPGISDTYEVSKATLSSSIKNSLLGVGSHGFYIAWNQYRPVYVNNLDIWNTDLQFGNGYLPTILINNGIIAFLLWICSLFALFFISVKSILKRGKKDMSATYTGVMLLLSSLLLWINMVVNTSGSAVIILTFLMTGLMVSSLVSDKVIKVMDLSLNKKKDVVEETHEESNGNITKEKKSVGYLLKDKIDILILVTLIILLISFAFVWIQRTRAQFYSAKSMQMVYAKTANISTVPIALSLLQKSFDLYHADIYTRGINNLALVQVNYDIASDPLNQNLQSGGQVHLQESTENYMKIAMSSGRDSVYANPNDFRNLLQFGSTMQTIALITSDQDSAKLALQSMIQAQSLAPNHPLPFYSIANLYTLAGNKEEALSVVNETLKLKTNFVEASELQQKVLSMSTSTIEVDSSTSTSSSTSSAPTTVAPTKTKTPIQKTSTKNALPKIIKSSVKKITK